MRLTAACRWTASTYPEVWLTVLLHSHLCCCTAIRCQPCGAASQLFATLSVHVVYWLPHSKLSLKHPVAETEPIHLVDFLDPATSLTVQHSEPQQGDVGVNTDSTQITESELNEINPDLSQQPDEGWSQATAARHVQYASQQAAQGCYKCKQKNL